MGPRERVRSRRTRPVHLAMRARGVGDLELLRALERAPRALFMPQRFSDISGRDVALPIGCGQTSPPPSTSPRWSRRFGSKLRRCLRNWDGNGLLHGAAGAACAGSRVAGAVPDFGAGSPSRRIFSRPSDSPTSPCFGWTPSIFTARPSLRQGHRPWAHRASGAGIFGSAGAWQEVCGRSRRATEGRQRIVRLTLSDQGPVHVADLGAARSLRPLERGISQAYSRHPAKKSRGGSSERRLLNIQPDKQFILNLPLTRLCRLNTSSGAYSAGSKNE